MTEMIDSRLALSEAISTPNPLAASVQTVQWSWPKEDIRPLAPGQRHLTGLPVGSADSLFAASWALQLAQELRASPSASQHKGALTLVIAENAARYQRLLQEVKAWQPSLRVEGLGDWETLAYEAFSPHQDLISERLNSLYLAITGQLDCLIVAAPTALQRLPPPHYLAANTFFFRTDQPLSVDRLRQQLQTAGYSPVGQVFSPGEYAIRGGLIDLYPMGSTLPYRLELFDDEIASIRVFDPESQRSVHPVREVRILPGREYPRDAESASKLRARWRETFEGDPSRCSLYKDAGNGLFGPGIEYYLPLLFDELSDLTSYLHPQAQILLVGDVQTNLEQTFAEVKTRWEFLRHDIQRPVLPPEDILLPTHQFNQTVSHWGQTLLSGSRDQDLIRSAPDVRADRQATPVLARLQKAIGEAANENQITVVCVDTDGRRETLAEMLEDSGISFARYELDEIPGLLQAIKTAPPQQPPSDCLLTVSPFHQGFQAPSLGLTLITEFELFADLQRRQRHGQRAKQTNVDAIIRDLSELKINDPVVHLQHGVGRYQGLINMDLGDGPNEFLHLIYAEGGVLYVPVAQLHLISRYSGSDPDAAPLHRLGGGQWEKAKSKAAKQAKDTAAELLNLYARRAAREGYAFGFQAADYERFADGFGFEETPDQLAAIHAVIQDMVSGKPMDRLICGDVGFGKTEVALRATFVAVMDGKQVAVLCPTTLLAEQHFQTFRDRFAAWPVKLAELSRFKSAKEVNESLEELAKGRVDILIGTHQLLSARTQFQRLGLIIIDEEHRFGVRQKEALKNLRAEVDVLTLTATPIPRTLAMSMEGIRDFSIIATAPQKRLAIKTMVRQTSDGTVREALLRELRRGGQAYVLHNQVETIQHRLEMLQAILPEARIGVAHGQLPERELEQVMRDFHQQRINVLLCTTIIETGIDVPTANTIIIYRADRFGLAQLHQLRGRVGRSHHQAYAYLLVPDEESITRDAKKRLEAITSMEELGSGFFLAMHDLEIRGAGEVLGDSQSGNMTEVGFQLYADMLQEAVNALKAGREPDLDTPVTSVTEIQLHLPALLPEDYCQDIRERLSLYKRMASAESQEDLSELQEELIDRFGKLPDPAKALLETHRLRLRCKAWNVIKIDAGPDRVNVQFGPNAPVNPAKVIKLIQADSRFRLQGNDRLRADISSSKLPERLQVLQTVFQQVLDASATTP
ncbi:MAG: transcription-repair coupling factor [Bordetella sp.]|jgi:transcription-repair coupling factor (superfamily II helicase)